LAKTNPFRLACSILHYDIIRYQFDDALKNMSKLGYAGAELHLPPPPHQKDWAPLRRLLKRLELTPATVVTFRYDWAHADPERVRGSYEHFKDTVKLAEYLDCRRVMTETGSFAENMSHEDATKMAAENMAKGADFASKHGVETLLLECVPPPFNYIVDNSKKFLEFRKLVGAKNLYANVDASNYMMAGDDPSTALEALGPLVKGIHIKDGKRQGGQWTPIGEGEVDWRAFLTTAKKIGYHDWLVAEYEGTLTGKYYSDPEKASKDTMAYLRKLIPTI
jgi:sugar phosphate isomerase/epimerase